jgi:hypothetical protein
MPHRRREQCTALHSTAKSGNQEEGIVFSGESEVECSAEQRSAVQCSTECSAVQFSAEQCSAVQCSAVQCSAVQCSVLHCSAVQCVTPGRQHAGPLIAALIKPPDRGSALSAVQCSE